jgi:membrane fusion protein (multidrug efflux system)
MVVWQWWTKARSRARIGATLGAVGLAGLLGACDKPTDQAKTAAPPPPPPAVVVAEVVRKTVPIYDEFVGQTDAKETVEIRARVKAFLEGQHFAEGTVVKKGQLLFTLDKREYEAKLMQAKADLDVALARLGKAETDERRLKPLAERRAVPQQDYDNATANLAAAQAGVAAARSVVAEAELNLGYTTIRSPIEGLIGKRLVAPGNLVGQAEATLLNTVSSINPIRVNASISETQYLKFLGQYEASGKMPPVELELILADGSVHPQRGRLVVVDRAVDEQTGTLTIIAEFPNPQGRLRPGQFGRIRAPVELVENALLVPRRAVQEIQDMKTLLVVGADNKVSLRTIRPGETVGDMLIVRDGVQAGERVIVDGVQKARPGSPVSPTLTPANAAAETKAPAPAAAGAKAAAK